MRPQRSIAGRLRRCAGAALLGCVMAGMALAQTDPLSQAVETTIQTNRAAAQSQDRVDKLDDQTRQLLERYRAALWQSQQLTAYAQQLGELLASQDAERASLERQLGEMDRVERDLMPLMLRMLDSLEKFVELDLPFLQRERQERIAGLRRMMADADVGVPEKFRRVLEAYQIEADYGRTLGAERAEVQEKVVDVLRIGRVALFALTLDGGEALAWDATQGQWQELERRFLPDVRKGLKIARETAAASLLRLPVAPAEKTP